MPFFPFPTQTSTRCALVVALAAAGSLVAEAQTLTQGATVSASSTTITPSTALTSSISRSDSSLPGAAETMPLATGSTLPQVFAPTRPRTTYTRYPWKRNITATVFWIGEKPTQNNPTPNNKSSWDTRWEQNFGGYDNPRSRDGYKPKGMETPGQNPFYIALPYNDIQPGTYGTKSSAREAVPWFRKHFVRSGRTVLKGRWIAIRRGTRVCYAQWEDVGPFETDDWEYVFGDSRPKTRKNKGAGLDISPAIRDYLGVGGYTVCDWRFVDVEEVPDGPWKNWGANNPFVKMGDRKTGSSIDRIVKLRELRDEFVQKNEE